jgi:uncharacterized protein (TIGR00251 family)
MEKSITISLKVITNAKKQKCDYKDGRYRVYLLSSPTRGKANKELIEFLARLLKIPKHNIEIISGEKSKNKVIKIIGVSNNEIKAIFS